VAQAGSDVSVEGVRQASVSPWRRDAAFSFEALKMSASGPYPIHQHDIPTGSRRTAESYPPVSRLIKFAGRPTPSPALVPGEFQSASGIGSGRK
jgi:hypothetical protein